MSEAGRQLVDHVGADGVLHLMPEEPDEEPEREQRAGELSVGTVVFGSLPYNLTEKEADEMHRELKAREARRIPPGFGR